MDCEQGAVVCPLSFECVPSTGECARIPRPVDGVDDVWEWALLLLGWAGLLAGFHWIACGEGRSPDGADFTPPSSLLGGSGEGRDEERDEGFGEGRDEGFGEGRDEEKLPSVPIPSQSDPPHYVDLTV